MSSRKTSKASGKPISSPASEDGRSLSGSLGGQKIGKSSREVVPASPSPSRAKLEAWATSGIYGPLFIGSSPSAVLQSALGNRLRARMAATGSPEYAMTWSEKDMPSGPPICALRASGRRTAGKGCTGWPTPRTPSGGPESSERKKELGRQKSGGGDLQAAALTAGWASPSARDWKDTPGMATTGTNPDGSTRSRLDQLPRQAAMAGWATPNAADSRSHRNQTAKRNKIPPTGIHLGQTLTDQTSGMKQESSFATNKTGQSLDGFLLNHRFSLWLQGFPVEWASCGERVGRSSRKSRRNS